MPLRPKFVREYTPHACAPPAFPLVVLFSGDFLPGCSMGCLSLDGIKKCLYHSCPSLFPLRSSPNTDIDTEQSQLEHAHRVKDERSAEALAAKRNAADLEQKVRFFVLLLVVVVLVITMVTIFALLISPSANGGRSSCFVL